MTTREIIAGVEGLSRQHRRVLEGIASHLDFECLPSVSERSLLSETCHDEATFLRIAGELEGLGLIRREAGDYRLELGAIVRLGRPSVRVRYAHEDTYAAQFTMSKRW